MITDVLFVTVWALLNWENFKQTQYWVCDLDIKTHNALYWVLIVNVYVFPKGRTWVLYYPYFVHVKSTEG